MAEEKNSCGFRTSIGGQALIEGILMRGPEKQAIVVRDQDGNLMEKVEALKMIKDRDVYKRQMPNYARASALR